MKIFQLFKTLTHLLLTVVITIYIITGFGISNYQIMESLTGNTLSKVTSYEIHSNLIIPLIILLVLHIIFALQKNLKTKPRKIE